MAAPAYALRLDVRYAELLALVAAGGWIGYSGRGRVAPLAAACLLFTPRSFFVLEQAWTESFVLCWAALVIYAAPRAAARRSSAPAWSLRGIALGLLVASKQHLAVALLFTGWLRREGEGPRATRAMLVAAIVAGLAITLPFLLWDPPGFWRSVVLLQIREPFRLDSLSVLSYLARQGWQPTPGALLAAPLAALAAGLALAWWRLPRTPAGFALALGMAFFLLFLVSKKAFCNYYFLVIGLLMAGVAAASREGRWLPADDEDSRPPLPDSGENG